MDHRERVRLEEQLLVLELLEAAMAGRDEVFVIVDSSEDADEAQGENPPSVRGARPAHQSRGPRRDGVTVDARRPPADR